ncbi:uncharacterized protein YALI1_E24120g [Yarrowia lipolytica]|uniref:Uncharacterized protein n=1 Tax=Yarrowia lipolytica TaxID=4952 RepID=A0A1D8NJ90_YARLL|nr:hypothetical protein YALI1_E24120g [Yarrowia lipolytica]
MPQDNPRIVLGVALQVLVSIACTRVSSPCFFSRFRSKWPNRTSWFKRVFPLSPPTFALDFLAWTPAASFGAFQNTKRHTTSKNGGSLGCYNTLLVNMHQPKKSGLKSPCITGPPCVFGRFYGYKYITDIAETMTVERKKRSTHSSSSRIPTSAYHYKYSINA